jgi:hypothetical protein
MRLDEITRGEIEEVKLVPAPVLRAFDPEWS